MRFTLTDEQRLLQSSALDWLADHYDFRSRRASLHRDGGSPAVWSAFADLGWLGLPLPEEVGGFGGGAMESGLLMQALGRHLVVEPFHACILQAARLLALTGTPRQQAEWLPSVIDGSKRLALAHAEPGDVLAVSPRRTVARRAADGWHIRGEKRLVTGASGAARLLISARQDDSDQHCLFLISPEQAGVTLDAHATSDGAHAADLHLDLTVAAQALVGDASATVDEALQRVLAEGTVAQGWEATGAMQAVLDQTTQYAVQRRQFGQTLSSFQVIQHRLAEMAVLCVEAQAACELATMRMMQEPRLASDMAALVKNKVGRAARQVSQDAVQLHGAMGVCEELPVAATFRMLHAFAQRGGDPASQAHSLGASLLASGAHANSRTLEACP